MRKKCWGHFHETEEGESTTEGSQLDSAAPEAYELVEEVVPPRVSAQPPSDSVGEEDKVAAWLSVPVPVNEGSVQAPVPWDLNCLCPYFEHDDSFLHTHKKSFWNLSCFLSFRFRLT